MYMLIYIHANMHIHYMNQLSEKLFFAYIQMLLKPLRKNKQSIDKYVHTSAGIPLSVWLKWIAAIIA